MTSFELIHQTLPLHLNTRGAQSLVTGDFEMAHECFQKALDELESGFEGGKRDPQRMPRSASRSTRFEDRQCFIYNTPFVIDSPSVSSGALRAALLFNLGLTFQACSMNSCGDMRLLKRAMGYYDQCLQAMDREKLVVAYPDFCIAALNNKSSVFFEVGAFQQGYKTLHLLSMMTQRVEMKGQMSLTQEALNGILFNIHYAGPPTLAGAA